MTVGGLSLSRKQIAFLMLALLTLLIATVLVASHMVGATGNVIQFMAHTGFISRYP